MTRRSGFVSLKGEEVEDEVKKVGKEKEKEEQEEDKEEKDQTMSE